MIAGDYQGNQGPAKTFSPINLWDIRVEAGKTCKLTLPTSFTTCLLVLEGCVRTTSGEEIREAELGVFDIEASELTFTAEKTSKLLLLNGQPLNEPIVGYGPFVMNTVEEIQQAFRDYKTGKMGALTPK